MQPFIYDNKLGWCLRSGIGARCEFSKTFEFENDFAWYLKNYIHTDISFYFDETAAQAEVDRLNKEKGMKIKVPFEEISFYKKEIKIN